MGMLLLNLALMASLCSQYIYMYMYMYKCYAIYYVNEGSKKGQASNVPKSQEPIQVHDSKRAAAGKFCACNTNFCVHAHVGNYAHPLILHDNAMHHYYCM